MLTKRYKVIQTNTINQDQFLFLNESFCNQLHDLRLLNSRKERGNICSTLSTIDEASNFANLLRATLPRHGFVISEPYPIVSDSLEKEFKERCDSPADMLGRIDEL